MSRNEVSNRIALKEIQEQYRYWGNVPPRGLSINGRPAMTQITPDEVGDFVLVTVRDPLIKYDKDPSSQIAGNLENARLIGNSGMFSSYTGKYKGANITIVSGGSGSAEAELLLYDFMEFSKAHTYIRVGGSGGIGLSIVKKLIESKIYILIIDNPSGGKILLIGIWSMISLLKLNQIGSATEDPNSLFPKLLGWSKPAQTVVTNELL